MIALPMTIVLLAAVLLLVAWAESPATDEDRPKPCADDRVVAR